MQARQGVVAQFARFGLVGVANTVVGSGLILLLTWQGVGPFLANVVGYVVGTALSFYLNSRWTFSAPMNGSRLLRFLLVIAAAYALNVLVLAVFLRIGWSGLASQLPAMVCFTVANFFGQRWFTYAPAQR